MQNRGKTAARLHEQHRGFIGIARHRARQRAAGNHTRGRLFGIAHFHRQVLRAIVAVTPDIILRQTVEGLACGGHLFVKTAQTTQRPLARSFRARLLHRLKHRAAHAGLLQQGFKANGASGGRRSRRRIAQTRRFHNGNLRTDRRRHSRLRYSFRRLRRRHGGRFHSVFGCGCALRAVMLHDALKESLGTVTARGQVGITRCRLKTRQATRPDSR